LPQKTAVPIKRVQDFDHILAPYRGPSAWYSCWQLASTLLLFLGGWTAMYWCLPVSIWLTVIMAVPTALLLVRLFIIQHDCGHQSFFRSRRANAVVGFAIGLLTFTPYECWRRKHAMHHATSSDLDRRGHSGEILTMTVEEYRNASWWRRMYYRLYRNPLLMFGIGSFLYFMVFQRFTVHIPKSWKRERRSVHLTNVSLLAAALTISWLVGWRQFLLVEGLVMFLAAGTGAWLFYMQHQYEDACWRRREQWNFVEAALAGSSYYRLPAVLQWFTGSIGLHHIHHLDARIPNYRLQACHDANPELHQVSEFSLVESAACLQAKLWHEEEQRMVGFRAAR